VYAYFTYAVTEKQNNWWCHKVGNA